MNKKIPARWPNQEEALQFALSHSSCMLDMDMGTGKTRVVIDSIYMRGDVHRVLIVCPKSTLNEQTWLINLKKFATGPFDYCDFRKGSVKKRAEQIRSWLNEEHEGVEFVVVNFDSVWRDPMGDMFLRSHFDMVVLDESHRAKAAGSKVSKYLYILGRRVKYRMCLSGTPMANSPLDVYGQYRFLDPQIFGTNHFYFMQDYAIMGGPERRFVVGYKNQQQLNEKFRSIAYTCKMDDIKDHIKLPDVLPPVRKSIELPRRDARVLDQLAEDFISECGTGMVVVSNVLGKILRQQQITSGFCMVQDDVLCDKRMEELNTAKQDALVEILQDISPLSSVVVFCVFRHDLDAVHLAGIKTKRNTFELSGSANQLEEWKQAKSGVLAVQIQAGSESVDMTKAHHVVYYSLPHSLALYNQSMARVYRPGQTEPVSFQYLVADGTIDEAMYESLIRKEDIIESVKAGTFNFGYVKK